MEKLITAALALHAIHTGPGTLPDLEKAASDALMAAA